MFQSSEEHAKRESIHEHRKMNLYVRMQLEMNSLRELPPAKCRRHDQQDQKNNPQTFPGRNGFEAQEQQREQNIKMHFNDQAPHHWIEPSADGMDQRPSHEPLPCSDEK